MFIYKYLWSGQQLFRIYEIDIQLSRYVCQNTVQRVNVTSTLFIFIGGLSLKFEQHIFICIS